jgi:hypothetical protein
MVKITLQNRLLLNRSKTQEKAPLILKNEELYFVLKSMIFSGEIIVFCQ